MKKITAESQAGRAADSCDFYRIRPRHEVRRSSLSINVCLRGRRNTKNSWRAARLEPSARIRFNFFLKIEFKEWRKKIGIAELIPFSTFRAFDLRVMAHRNLVSATINIGAMRCVRTSEGSGVRPKKPCGPHRFSTNTMRTPLRVRGRVPRAIFLKLRAAPGRFQKQSKGIKTRTRYRIRYALSLIRYSWPAKKPQPKAGQ